MSPFNVHPRHSFQGFELVQVSAQVELVVARCGCGAILDVAPAAFRDCPACDGTGAGNCLRCAGTGEVLDHGALGWRQLSDLERDALLKSTPRS